MDSSLEALLVQLDKMEKEAEYVNGDMQMAFPLDLWLQTLELRDSIRLAH